MIIEYSVEGDLQDLQKSLGDARGTERALERFLDSTAIAAHTFAYLHAPKQEHKLVDEIGRDKASRQTSGAVQARVGVGPVDRLPGGQSGPLRDKQSDYPFFVHEGTGIYGKLRRPIRPRRARAMRFYGHTGLIYAMSVKGQRPQPFMEEAFHDVQPYIEGHLGGLVRDILDGPR